MIFPRRRRASPLTTDRPMSAAARPPPGQRKVQAADTTLAQKCQCPQYVYIHLQTAYSVKDSEGCSGPVWAGLSGREAAGPPARGRGAGAPLVQLIRKVILCFQYETFHTVKSNPKTSWIQSSHTFKRDFYLVLNRVQTTEDVTSK